MWFFVVVIFLSSIAASAQNLNVMIVDRQYNETDYSYVVPARFTAYSTSNATAWATDSYATATGTTTTTGTVSPAHEVSYQVHGATLSILLQDGRLVIANCESKFAERFAGPAGNHRSCRVPLVNNIQAEFHGDKAKLQWTVSIDGKKMQSETYKILAVLEKNKNGQN